MRSIARIFVLLALALPALCLGDEGDSSKPMFLVARAELPDPNFHNTVVLLTRHGPGGAIGLIVNRPTDILLSKALPDFKKLSGVEDKLFFGGPVARETVVFIFRSPLPRADSAEILPGVRIGSGTDLLRELLDRDKPTEGLRVFAGLAGWAPGQLEAEIERGDWRRIPADEKSLLATKPESLWAELYRRAFATMARNDVPAPAH
jgi:putative transcriptional regulator